MALKPVHGSTPVVLVMLWAGFALGAPQEPRAEHFSKQQEPGKAIQAYRQALKIYPSYYEARNNLALEYFTAGEPDRAIRTLRDLTLHDPTQVLAYDNLAIILSRLHRYGDAEAAASRAVEMHPFSYKANFVCGCALVNQGKWTPEARRNVTRKRENCLQSGPIPLVRSSFRK